MRATSTRNTVVVGLDDSEGTRPRLVGQRLPPMPTAAR